MKNDFNEKKAKEDAEKMLKIIEKDPQAPSLETFQGLERLGKTITSITNGAIVLGVGTIVLNEFSKAMKEPSKNNNKTYKHPPITVKGSKMNMRKK